jgi:Fe2+ transport system protein FeoA
VWPWWHADRRIIAQQRNKLIEIGILPGADIAVEQRPLLVVWRWQGW